jgi:fused signal recognition particle receptor
MCAILRLRGRLLARCVEELLEPLERPLVIGAHTPTVIMVVGVNGAGKTTSIGKLARHLLDSQQNVLLAAADTFRAAAREQLLAWAERAGATGAAAPGSHASGRIEIVSQEGGDPAGVDVRTPSSPARRAAATSSSSTPRAVSRRRRI